MKHKYYELHEFDGVLDKENRGLSEDSKIALFTLKEEALIAKRHLKNINNERRYEVRGVNDI